jgi:xanthine dehydrogenase YagT iron-sulfur-binding subunit
MAERNADDSRPQIPRVTRRGFLKGAGVAAGTALLEGGLAAHADAQELATEAKVLGPGPVPISFTLNGHPMTLSIDPGTTLAEVLRLHLGLTGTKVGCDRGACSACTVWINGQVASSCMTLALDIRDAKVTTIEGLSDGERLHPVQQAFIEHDALQCGFCTPGMIMSCAALVDRKGDKCTIDDVKGAISGHLCRCGTYPNIFAATAAAASNAPKAEDGKAGAQ